MGLCSKKFTVTVMANYSLSISKYSSDAEFLVDTPIVSTKVTPSSIDLGGGYSINASSIAGAVSEAYTNEAAFTLAAYINDCKSKSNGRFVQSFSYNEQKTEIIIEVNYKFDCSTLSLKPDSFNIKGSKTTSPVQSKQCPPIVPILDNTNQGRSSNGYMITQEMLLQPIMNQPGFGMFPTIKYSGNI
jgi:hypothetical protein